MKNLLRLLCGAVMGLSVLSCYDDTALRDLIEGQEERIGDLETLCSNLNVNISSLQSIIQAVQNADYITSVTPLVEGGNTVGYTVVFAKYGTITIKNGTDAPKGEDTESETVPVIGAKQDKDGLYYWTLDGEWLVDDSGDKVSASGKAGADGSDGVTPLLKIEDGYWYVSYDKGSSWSQLGKATGEDGKDGTDGKDGVGGDSIFKDVYEKNGFVYFMLSDGTTYKVPTADYAVSDALGITFDMEQGTPLVPGAVYAVRYAVTGGDENTIVRVVSTTDYADAVIRRESATTGIIYIMLYKVFDGPDDPYRDVEGWVTNEEHYNTELSILVSVSDGRNNSLLKSLNLTEGFISMVDDVYVVDAIAGTFTVQVKTNVDYTVMIPGRVEWLSLAPESKAEMRTDEIEFSVQTNDTPLFRSTIVYLENNAGETIEEFEVVQRSVLAGVEIKFADASVKKACLDAFDTDLNGILTIEEAVLVKDISTLVMPKDAVSFDELEQFTSIGYIPAAMFADCVNLESVILPEQIAVIGEAAFYNCRSLKTINMPDGMVYVGCNYPETESPAEYLGKGVFENCESLTSIVIPGDAMRIGHHAFRNSGLSGTLEIPATVSYIGEEAFVGTDLESVRFLSEIPCETGGNMFDWNVVIYVPDGCYDAYRSCWDNIYHWADIAYSRKPLYGLGNDVDENFNMLRGRIFTYDESFRLSSVYEFDDWGGFWNLNVRWEGNKLIFTEDDGTVWNEWTLNERGYVIERTSGESVYYYEYDADGHLIKLYEDWNNTGRVLVSVCTWEDGNMTSWSRENELQDEYGNYTIARVKRQTYTHMPNSGGIFSAYPEKTGLKKWMFELGYFGTASKNLLDTDKWDDREAWATFDYILDSAYNVLVEKKYFDGELDNEYYFFWEDSVVNTR